MTEALTKEKRLYCPTCGKESVVANKCELCEWVGCEAEDHDYGYQEDRDVGIQPHLECSDCGLTIDYDGRYDESDWP